MSDCKAYREEIEELAGVGRLSAEARAHVNACAPCRGLEEERASLRRLVRGLERVEAPADFEFRLRSRIRAARGGQGRWPLRPAYGFAALAASALFLFVSASLYITQERQTKPGAGRHEALTAAGAGDANPARKKNTAQTIGAGAAETGNASAATVTNTADLGGQTPRAVQGVQRRVKTRAASAARAGNVAQSVPPFVAGAKNSLTASLNPAQVIERSPTLTVPVGTNAETLRVVLRDESGAQRVVPMRSVSFGAQELIAREGQAKRAPAADKEGVW
jgi:hypothetical protein